MSRTRNHLQKHVEEYLADRHDMRDWIRRVQTFSPWITATEWDWELYGHLPIDQWLIDKHVDEHDDPWEDWQEDYDDAREQEMAEYFYKNYDSGDSDALDKFAGTL